MCKNWYGWGNSLPTIGEGYFTSFKKDVIELELGELDWGTGKPVSNSNKVRTKDYIKVNSNTKIKITVSNYSKSNAVRWLLYDNNNNFIESYYFSLYAGGTTSATIETKTATKLKLYMNGADLDAVIKVEEIGV